MADADHVPLTRTQLQERFARDYFEPAQVPAGAQAELLVRLLKLYSHKGLLPEKAPRRLCDCCERGQECWSSLSREEHPSGDGENGGLVLPWVGPGYQRGGVVVVAINPNIRPEHPTNLLIEHDISWNFHQCGLELNHKQHKHVWFAFRAMRSAAALLDLLDGAPVRYREPSELVDTLHRTARLQAVKCIPLRKGSEPTRAMWRNCPPFLLADELDVLQPRYVLTLGGEARNALSALPGFQWGARASRIRVGCVEIRGEPAEVFSIAHPASRGAKSDQDYRALVASLRRSQRSRSTSMSTSPQV